MIDHDRYRWLAAGSVDGVLTDDEVHEFGLHLRTCAICRAEVHHFERDREQLMSLPPTPVAPRVRTIVEMGARAARPSGDRRSWWRS